MHGKTHMMVGVLGGIAILQPKTMTELTAGTLLAGVGAVICDIDIGSSAVRRKADKIALVCMGSLGAAAGLQICSSLMERAVSDVLLPKVQIGYAVMAMILAFLICLYGRKSSHRGFMHSFAALLILGVCARAVFPALYLYFTTGFLSHLLLDLFNTRGLQLLFPYKKRYCLHVWTVGGKEDISIGKAASVANAILIFIHVTVIMKRQFM